MSKVIYLVNSDNYQNAYMTGEAYEAMRLCMSTGDYSMHRATKVTKIPKGADVMTLKEMDPEAYYAEAMKNYPKALREFAVERSFRKQMSCGLDSYANYGGDDLGDLVSVVSQSRDSDTLAESNFASALEMLGGESESVIIHRFGHWACGWFETIFVDPSDQGKLQIAFEIRKALENYPVIDDSDFSERENDKLTERFEQNQGEFEAEVCALLEIDLDEMTDELSAKTLKALRKEISIIAENALQYDSGYQGADDAWVTNDSIKRYLKNAFYLSEHMLSVMPLLAPYLYSITDGAQSEVCHE